jgi:hypothetical protein
MAHRVSVTWTPVGLVAQGGEQITTLQADHTAFCTFSTCFCSLARCFFWLAGLALATLHRQAESSRLADKRAMPNVRAGSLRPLRAKSHAIQPAQEGHWHSALGAASVRLRCLCPTTVQISYWHGSVIGLVMHAADVSLRKFHDDRGDCFRGSLEKMPVDDAARS